MSEHVQRCKDAQSTLNITKPFHISKETFLEPSFPSGVHGPSKNQALAVALTTLVATQPLILQLWQQGTMHIGSSDSIFWTLVRG